MLAYAAHRRRVAESHSAPHAMLLIIVAHLSVIAAVMSARMDLPPRIFDPPIIVTPIPLPEPTPPQTNPRPHDSRTTADRTQVIVPMSQPNNDGLDTTPDPLPLPGNDAIGPRFDPVPTAVPVRAGPRFATPPADVRPPYPPSKIQSQQEAVLRLKLSIDLRGRVVAVEPVGKADPAFLAAARRHLIAA
jgi:protein TonB